MGEEVRKHLLSLMHQSQHPTYQGRNQVVISVVQNDCNLLFYLTTKKVLALSKCFWKFRGEGAIARLSSPL